MSPSFGCAAGDVLELEAEWLARNYFIRSRCIPRVRAEVHNLQSLASAFNTVSLFFFNAGSLFLSF